MPPFNEIAMYVAEHPAGSAVIGVFTLITLVLAYFALRTAWRALVRAYRRTAGQRPTEDVLTIVAASIATGVSAQGMWRFSEDVLHFDGPLRILLFAFIEVAVITSAFRARRNMRENYSAGIDGIAVWALTALTAILASMDARSIPEAAFRLSAPLVAAWLWERGMAIERHRITGKRRINWRITPERVLVRIGLAESSERTASEVDAHRRLTRVALAAKRARALRDAGASPRRMRAALARLDREMDRAVEYAGLASDPARQEALLAQIGALYNAGSLIDLEPRAPWGQALEAAPKRPALEAAPTTLGGFQDWRESLESMARDYWDEQIEKGVIPTTAELAEATGADLPFARRLRSRWKNDPETRRAIARARGFVPEDELPEEERAALQEDRKMLAGL